MPLSLDEIKLLETVNFDPFEIRGAKSGIGNARTTGPLYTSGSYIPTYGTIYGDASFSSDSSIVIALTLHAPYSGLDARNLKIGDTLTYGSSRLIDVIVDQTSVWLDATAGFTGTADFTASLIPRDYLVEPDKINNTFYYGTTVFSEGSPWVLGVGTTWLTDLTSNDYIKSDSYQKYFRILQVSSDSTLKLATPFIGTPTVIGPSTAKKQLIDQMYYRYTKDDFRYEKNGGFWIQNDSTTDSDLLATTNPVSMVDGVDLRFVHSINPNAPDMMDSNLALNLDLARRTTRPIFQFPLPAVPNPEESLELKINKVTVVRGQDYVVSYSQDPIYITPPAPEDRQVANLMFLLSEPGQNLSGVYNGNIKFVDSSGNSIVGVMPGTETIQVNGADQTVNIDYLLDADAGVAVASSAIVEEPLVKYVGKDISELLSYGISFSLDGRKLRYSIPPRDTDEVRMAPEVGRVVPVGSDHPAPGEEYMVNYQVQGGPVTNEVILVSVGMTAFRVSQYPLKDNSVILVKNSEILDEDTDFRVSTQTGRIILTSPIVAGDSISVSYYPLVKQVNGLSYPGNWTCTSYGTRLAVVSASSFEFSLADYALDPRQITILRVYNETRNKDYDLTGLTPLETTFILAANPTNIAIGLDVNDVITINYEFLSEPLEYFPVLFNNYSVLQDSSTMYLQAIDARPFFSEGSVVRLVPSNARNSYLFAVRDAIYDGEDTSVNFYSKVPQDLVNPRITASDASVSFVPIGFPAEALVSGSNSIRFPGLNRPDMFRPYSAIKIGGSDLYGVAGASFDSEATVVSLSSSLASDWTSVSELNSVEISDCPIYDEGTVSVLARKPVITTPEQPGLTLSYQSKGTAYVSIDASAMSIVTDASSYRFDWNNNATLADLSGSLSIGPFAAAVYISDWMSLRLKPVSGLATWLDSSTVLPVRTSLLFNGQYTEDFQIFNEGITLNSGLEPGQRYSLDYIGRDYLGDSTVSYSARYFSMLPARSRLQASFQYDNLDQFYVQVMTRLQFLEEVVEPAIDEENAQLAGGGGQGGDLPSDADQGNAEGGLVNDPFRQRDAEIWCRTYETIYDYFSDRLQDLSAEMYSVFGYKLCNNDGLLSKYDQGMIASKSFNRLWPNSDWTSYDPALITPLTGATNGPGGAIFTNGSNIVTGVVDPNGFGTRWELQTLAGGWIRPVDGTRDYMVVTALSDSTVIIMDPYAGPTSSSDGELFTLTSKFPLFDDDGYLGPKINGTRASIRPKLVNGDVFSCWVDGVQKDATFSDPTFPPPLSKQKSLRKFSLDDAAQTINNDIPEINATAEWIFDASSSYGYKTVLVLRTLGSYNRLSIASTGSANFKLGFTSDMTAVGNYDTSDSSSESMWLSEERGHLVTEQGLVSEVIAIGIPPRGDKVDRSSAYALPYLNGILPEITDQTNAIHVQLTRLSEEIDTLQNLLLEPNRPDASQTLTALYLAQQAVLDCSSALSADGSMLGSWMGAMDPGTWALDFTAGHQKILGKNTSTGIGGETVFPFPYVPIAGQTTFILEVPAGYDRRIANFDANKPVIRYADSSGIMPGIWSGWDTTGAQQVFSIASTETSPVVITNALALTLYWTDMFLQPQSSAFPYSTYSTVGALKTGINTVSGFDATGNNAFNLYKTDLVDATNNIFISGVNIFLKGIDSRYSITNQISFQLYQSALFTIGNSPDKTSPYVITDESALTIRWVDPYGSQTSSFMYSMFPTVGTMKSAINLSPGFDATGNLIYDGDPSGFQLGSEYMNPRVTVYPGLKPCFVDYQTLSDKNLTDRTDYIVDRIAEIDTRLGYFNGTRRTEIVQTVSDEELLRASDGGRGNLYIWANNRFNRVQGCESKLVQTKAIQSRNGSALTVNKTLA